MRAFVVLSFVVCLAVAKPQYGYNYEPPTAYQTSASGLQQQQQYSLAAPVQQTQYTQPQSYAAYPTQDQYYQSYSTAAAPIQQTAYTSQEQQPSLLQSTGQFDQASYANAAPLQQNAYAGVSQTQFDQTQLQQASYPTADPSSLEQSSYASAGQVQFEQVQLQQVAPLEQTSFVGASQAPLQQTSYSTASSSGLEQSSYANAGQSQFDQAQLQQASYSAASPSPLEQSSYANAGQTQFAQAQYQQAAFPTASPSPLEQSSYANAGQHQFDQAQLQQASYPTASPSPLEQSSYANAGQPQFDQAQLQQASYPTASPSPLEQSSYANAGQTQYQQAAFPTASPSPLEQSSYAGNQLPLTLPTSASYETGFLPSQAFPLQQEPSPSTTFNGLTGFNAQPYQAAAYSNGAAYDQSQFFNVDSSYTTNTDFAQLQQYASQLSQAQGQQDDTSGTLDSFNIQSTIGPNPADVAPPSPSPAPAQQQQQQQQQDEPQNFAQNTEAQGPAFNAQAQPQSQAFDDQGPPQGPAFNAGAQQQEAEQPQQPQQPEQPQQQQQDQQQQFGPNQSQNVLPLEQIAPEPIQARQKQQGPVTTIHKHIYVHVPPPDFEEPEPLPQAPLVENKNKRYNIIFIKAPNVARPTIIQPQQNEDKTIVYVLVKKPDEIQPFAQPEPRFGKPEVFFIKYKAQKEQTAAEELSQEQQPQQAEDPESVVVEDRSKQPSQAPQFPALEGQEAQALLREEEQKQQQDEQQEQQQPQTLAAPSSPTRAPSNAGISPLPIDFIPPAAPKTASPAPPQNYLPPSFQQ